MIVLGIDLGGTKLTASVFTEDGIILRHENVPIGTLKGTEVGKMITDVISRMLNPEVTKGDRIAALGISVPGISFISQGTVWAPNIEGWENYPLLEEVKLVTGDIPVIIDSDRACYILGEVWQGNAKGCKDAIFLAVGTGIGAGILVNGEILRGSNDIAGCIGWMALNRPFNDLYKYCGCFEYHASGEGMGKVARQYLSENREYAGELAVKVIEEITSYDIFNAYKNDDLLAKKILNECIEYWGMAVANLVSLFNPEKIIIGGGVFGPALSLIPEILKEAKRWAQPVGITQVKLEPSGLGGDAGVFGAGYLAMRSIIKE